MATLQQLDYAKYIGGWEKFLETASSAVIDDIAVLKDDDPVDYENLRRQGIERLIATSIYHSGRLISHLCADNYEWDSRVNTVAVFEIVSYFIAAIRRVMKRSSGRPTCSRSATAVRMPTAWAVTSSSC